MHRDWISTTRAARDVGMSDEWIRQQIRSGRLKAMILEGVERRTFRISRSDWLEFRSRWCVPSTDFDWDAGEIERDDRRVERSRPNGPSIAATARRRPHRREGDVAISGPSGLFALVSHSSNSRSRWRGVQARGSLPCFTSPFSW